MGHSDVGLVPGGNVSVVDEEDALVLVVLLVVAVLSFCLYLRIVGAILS